VRIAVSRGRSAIVKAVKVVPGPTSLQQEAADGFNVMFSHLPGGASEFVAQVVPLLQKRGLLRRRYEGRCFRENLGLVKP